MTAYNGDMFRGHAAWYMNVEDLILGHDTFGFDYPIDGDWAAGRWIK